MNPSTQTIAAGLRARAAWHRAESRNFLRHSVQAMRQHELEAEELERQAAELEAAQ